MAPKKSQRELRAEQKKKARQGYAEKFGANLAEVRRAKRITQEEAARLAEVSVSAYTSWEQGKRIPGADLLWDICRALGVDLGKIVVKPD